MDEPDAKPKLTARGLDPRVPSPMRYIDSGSGNQLDALGYWLQSVLTMEIAELRWQTGYFSSDALGLFAPTLQRLAHQNAPVLGVIGSNQGRTLKAHVELLAQVMGIPRTLAHLGVLRFGTGLFHPKTYHFVRTDGTQAAYVGSANFTSPGLSSQNVEAGIVLDTRYGDTHSELAKIGAAVDAWFSNPALFEITHPSQIDPLVLQGVLAAAPPSPSPPATPSAPAFPIGTAPPTLPPPGGPHFTSLVPLFPLPLWGLPVAPAAPLPALGPAPQGAPTAAVTIAGFPPY